MEVSNNIWRTIHRNNFVSIAAKYTGWMLGNWIVFICLFLWLHCQTSNECKKYAVHSGTPCRGFCLLHNSLPKCCNATRNDNEFLQRITKCSIRSFEWCNISIVLKCNFSVMFFNSRQISMFCLVMYICRRMYLMY